MASQWQLMWLRFRRHRLAVASFVLLAGLYLLAAFCEFLAPYGPSKRNPHAIPCPPQALRFIDEDGGFHLRPFVYGYELSVDPQTWRREYTPDPQAHYPVQFLVEGATYEMWGLIPGRLRLFGTQTATSTCSAPTSWGETCSAASCTVGAHRLLSDCSACC